MPHSATLAAVASISLVLGGCATTKESVLPQDGPDIRAIYDGHFQWSAGNEIDTVFPRLPNPTLVMYVFPHLAEDEVVPVPGYVTAFPMYERVEYALPGEVPAQSRRRGDGSR